MLFLVHQARLRWLISKLFVMQLMSKTGALQHMSFYSLLKQLVKVHLSTFFIHETGVKSDSYIFLPQKLRVTAMLVQL